MKRFSVILTLFFLIPAVSAAWTINDVNGNGSPTDISVNNSTVQLVQVKDGQGNPVNESEMQSSGWTFNYTFTENSTTVEKNMEPLMNATNGYWYAPLTENNGTITIEYELSDPQNPGSSEINLTEALTAGNYTVGVKNTGNNSNNIRKKILNPGEDFFVEAELRNNTSSTDITGANVDAYLTNGSWTSNAVNLGYNNGRYTNVVSMPQNPDSHYVLQVVATKTGAGYNNPHGLQSILIDLRPPIKGQITELATTNSACNNSSMFNSCEYGAEIDAGINITESSAESVKMNIYAKNASNQNWENLSVQTLSENSGTYENSFEIPELNTTKYDKKLKLSFHLKGKYSQTRINRTIDYRTYRINGIFPDSSPGNYDITFSIEKYFSGTKLDKNYVNGTVNVTNPSNEEIDSFNISDMDQDQTSGLLEKQITIPFNEESGTYTAKVNTSNKFNQNKTLTGKFTVLDVNETFTADDEEISVSNTGNHSFDISFENLLSENITITSNLSEKENATIWRENESFDLESGDQEVEFNLNITYIQDMVFDLEFTDNASNYSENVEIEVNTPSCDYRDEEICVEIDENEFDVDEEQTLEEDFTVKYLGELNSSTDLTVTTSGNISDMVTVSNSSFTLNDSENEIDIDLNLSVDQPGFFEGNLTISDQEHEVNVPLELDSEVTPTDTDVSVSEVDLGTVKEDAIVTKEVRFENTGNTDVSDITLEGEGFEVSADSFNVGNGEIEDVEVEFSSITGSGTVTWNGTVNDEYESGEFDVSATLAPNYVEQSNNLDSQLSELDSQINDENLQTQLNNAQLKIPRIKQAYREGDIQEAERLYNEVRSTLTTLESSISSSQDTGGQAPTGNDGSTSTGTSPMVIAGIIVFVLLLIGIVAYTSIIPEEGDPLFNVLGER